MDWPGLDRWGTSEDDAIARLLAYVPRYAGVAERAGLGSAFARARDVEVVERVPGSSSTDFWGIAHVPSQIEREVLSSADLERRLDLLRACWASFDDVAARVSAELRPGPRSAGRSRDEIIRHMYINELEQMSRKVGGPHRPRRRLDARRASRRIGRHTWRPSAPTTPRARRPKSWPIQFLVRRTAHHVMDHAWEMEDRDLTDA